MSDLRLRFVQFQFLGSHNDFDDDDDDFTKKVVLDALEEFLLIVGSALFD